MERIRTFLPRLPVSGGDLLECSCPNEAQSLRIFDQAAQLTNCAWGLVVPGPQNLKPKQEKKKRLGPVNPKKKHNMKI